MDGIILFDLLVLYESTYNCPKALPGGDLQPVARGMLGNASGC